MRTGHPLHRRITCFIGLALLCMLYPGNTAWGAANPLKQIRCHLYELGDRPVSVRIALDFQSKPERMILQPSETTPDGTPRGFVEAFLISTESTSSRGLINPVNFLYTNARKIIHLSVINHEIHIAVNEDFTLQQSKFKYIPESNVSYIDLELAQRSETRSDVEAARDTAQNKDEVKRDTVILEKFIRDTVFIREIVRDTVAVEKLVYTEDEEIANRLLEVSCEHFVHWWSDPHFKLDFKFNLKAAKLTIKRTGKRLEDLPEGYDVQYVICPEGDNPDLFGEDVKINYIRNNGKLLLKLDKSGCYLLARRGCVLKPYEFAYDDYANIAYIRVRY